LLFQELESHKEELSIGRILPDLVYRQLSSALISSYHSIEDSTIGDETKTVVRS
jgi:hypothetical protein